MSWLDNNGLLQLVTALKAHIPATYAGSPTAGGVANKAAAIPTGSLDSTSTAKVLTATVSGITELADGVAVMLKNGVISSASGCTLNINGLGAKPIYQSLAAASRVTTAWNVNYTMLFVYNSTRVSGGCWDMYYGVNTTYSALTEADMQTGTATTARLITAARLKQAVEYHAPVTSVNGSTGDVTVPTVPTGTNSDDMLLWDSTNQEWITSAFASEVSFALSENVTVEQIMFTTDGTTVTSVDTSQECIIKAFNAKEKYFLIAISQTEVVACQPFYIAGNGAIFGLYAWKDGQIIYTFLTASSASAPYTGTLNTVSIPTTSDIQTIVQNYVDGLNATGVSY